MNKELYEKLVKPNVVELDNKIDQIDMSKAEGKIEEYDYQKELDHQKDDNWAYHHRWSIQN